MVTALPTALGVFMLDVFLILDFVPGCRSICKVGQFEYFVVCLVIMILWVLRYVYLLVVSDDVETNFSSPKYLAH